MIDIHSHILPGVDDGARTLGESMAMLDMAIDSGVTTQVLTPHIHQGRFDNDRKFLTESFTRFRDQVDAKNLPIKLLLAAELRIGPEIMKLAEANEIPCLGEYQGKKTFLLEFPRDEVPFGSENLVKWLMVRNYLPVIVHPERNSTFLRQRHKLKMFVDLGCHFQITASSLLGKFGADVQTMAEQLLIAQQVSAIASDCHNLKGRAPDLLNGFNCASIIIGDAQARQLVDTIPARLTSNNPSIMQ